MISIDAAAGGSRGATGREAGGRGVVTERGGFGIAQLQAHGGRPADGRKASVKRVARIREHRLSGSRTVAVAALRCAFTAALVASAVAGRRDAGAGDHRGTVDSVE